jgi:hypothetical protein
MPEYRLDAESSPNAVMVELDKIIGINTTIKWEE